MYATTQKIKTNATLLNSPNTDNMREMQVAQRNSPRWTAAQLRWTDAQLQLSIPFCLRILELFDQIQAHLKLQSLLRLMSTCKAIYNCCQHSLVLKAVIPTSLAELTDSHIIPKLTFANQTNIPFKLALFLSNFQNPALEKALQNNPSLTALITKDYQLTYLIALLTNNPLSEDQLLFIRLTHSNSLVEHQHQITALDLSNVAVTTDTYPTFKNLFDILSENKVFCKLQSLSLGTIHRIPNPSELDLSTLSIKHLSLGTVLQSITKIHFPTSLKSLSLDCDVYPRLYKFPPFLEILYFRQIMIKLNNLFKLPPLESLYLIDVSADQDLSKLPANLNNLSIQINGKPKLILSNLPSSLKSFSLNLAVKDYTLVRGDTIIHIKKGCRDINILFSENYYFPCIELNKNAAITVSQTNNFFFTSCPVEIQSCYYADEHFLFSSELLNNFLWYADFHTCINLVSICRALHKSRMDFLKQKAMITFPVPELDGSQKTSDKSKIAKLKFAQKHTGIHTRITINDLQDPSEFLINTLKLSLTLEIKNDYQLDQLIKLSNPILRSQLTSLNKIKHLDLNIVENLFLLSKVIAFFNKTHFKQLTKLSLGDIGQHDLSKSFQTIQHLHLKGVYSKFDSAKLPPCITKLSFACIIDQNLDFSKINPLVENITIAAFFPYDTKLIFKNGTILEIKETKYLNIEIPLKNGYPGIEKITSSDHTKITIMYPSLKPSLSLKKIE